MFLNVCNMNLHHNAPVITCTINKLYQSVSEVVQDTANDEKGLRFDFGDGQKSDVAKPRRWTKPLITSLCVISLEYWRFDCFLDKQVVDYDQFRA